MIQLWTCLVRAMREEPNGDLLDVAEPIGITARDYDRALELAWVACQEDYPPSEGWYNHHVCVAEIPADMVMSVARSYVKAQKSQRDTMGQRHTTGVYR